MRVRVVDRLRVAQQRPRQRAQLQQLMPLPPGPGQPRHLDAQHDADVIEADLRHQPLEPGPDPGTGRRVAQVLIDHQDPGRLPAQLSRAPGQPVLQPRRLAVLDDLRHRGLAHVNHREPVPVPFLDLAPGQFPWQPRRRVHHARPRPGRHTPPGSSASSVPPSGIPPPPGSPPAAPPTPEPGPAEPWLRGHGSPCMHSAPSSPGPPPSTRSLRTAAASASKPSIPITGAFPLQ